MKKTIIPLLCFVAAASTASAAIVFQDDFSEADGTDINGKAPDVGSNWSVTVGAPLNIASSRLDTSGAARNAFGDFTTSLSAGNILTMTYDTSALGNFFSGGFAGVSLYQGGVESIFTGDTGGDVFWGVVESGVGETISTDNTTATSATFTYTYDDGSWTFTTTSGVNLSGTMASSMDLDRLRIANGSGGDIAVDNLTIDISAVPEPSSTALLGLGGLAIMLRRRK